MPNIPVFDGHNDILLKLYRMGGLSAVPKFIKGCEGHIDVPRARTGGFGGGFFAIYVPNDEPYDEKEEEMQKASYSLPLPDPISQKDALPVALAQAAILIEMDRQGAVKIVRTAAELAATLKTGTMAAIMHMEGAEAIDPDFHALDVLYGAGLRSLGPVWSRPTIFGEGVPFVFPSDGNIGGGLTDDGIQLVKKCNDLGIMIDLSHLNEAGFWDVARHSNAPLVATHSNAHALSPHSRNLTDKQLATIGESGGMAGLNYAVAFLREDGRMLAEVPFEQMLAHLDHMMNVAGEDCVGLGSDFDGAVVPAPLADVAGLPKLQKAMQDHGYDDSLIEKLCFKNWQRVLERIWGE